MTGAAKVYGQALYDLAREEGLAEGIGEELRVLKEAILESPDFVRLVSSPSIPRGERLNIITDSFGGRVHPYVLNFMRILTEKGYMRFFAACCDVYHEGYNLDHGIMPVVVTTARPISEDQAARLRRRISAITGKQIELSNAIDPACIGGVRLDYDGKRMDDTVQNRLDGLRRMLKNTIL